MNTFSGAFLSVQVLLKHGGYFMGSLLKSHETFDAYLHLAKNEKYSKYLQDATQFNSANILRKKPVGKY